MVEALPALTVLCGPVSVAYAVVMLKSCSSIIRQGVRMHPNLSLVGLSCCLLLASPIASAQPSVPHAVGVASAPSASDANVSGLRIQPANTGVGSARNLIPDGTSLADDWSDGADQWFVAEVERAKGYLLEVIDINDHNANAFTLNVFEADGTTPLSNVESVDCAQAHAAPSFTGDGSTSSDGQRCSIYIHSGAPDTKIITIQAHLFVTTQPLRIRLRENNVLSRWTTNAYNMFVALQNNTAFPVSGFVLYYQTGANSSIGFPTFDSFTIQPYDNVQFTHAAGSIPTNKGMLRVAITNGTDVNAQTFAFNLNTGSYLFFTPEKPNHGGANSW